MTPKSLLVTFVVLALLSCNNSRTQDKPSKETPKALEDNSSSFELISKRGPSDLVESLYKELISKNPSLKDLEKQIQELNSSKADSTIVFDNYNEKNLSYFNSAANHISAIKDSVLRQKMKTLIDDHSRVYNASIASHLGFLSTIEANDVSLSDLHTVLKLVKTLPLIEKYQKDNLPDTKPLEGYINQQKKAINLADSLIK